MDHPFAGGEPVYDVTFENVQAGLRTDYLFRLANQRGGIVLGTGDLSELALGWCTYGVGDQMSHYAVNTGVPEDPDPAPHPLGDLRGALRRRGQRGAAGDRRRRRSPPSWSRREERRARAGHRGVDRPLLAAGLQPLLHAALRVPAQQDRLPRHPRLGRPGRRATGRPGTPTSAAASTTSRRSVSGWRSSSSGSSASRSSSAARCPNGPKVSAGGSLSPRGDWRAPSDGNARAWLEDIERNIPTAEPLAACQSACQFPKGCRRVVTPHGSHPMGSARLPWGARRPGAGKRALVGRTTTRRPGPPYDQGVGPSQPSGLSRRQS